MVATEYWTKILQRGDSIDIIYFDFKKAFDSVPHRRLLTKLKAYGIDGLVLKWIDCWQETTCGYEKFIFQLVRCYQWNNSTRICFGSLTIYINDLPSNLSNPTLLFAYHTKIFCHIPRSYSSQNVRCLQERY